MYQRHHGGVMARIDMAYRMASGSNSWRGAHGGISINGAAGVVLLAWRDSALATAAWRNHRRP